MKFKIRYGVALKNDDHFTIIDEFKIEMMKDELSHYQIRDIIKRMHPDCKCLTFKCEEIKMRTIKRIRTQIGFIVRFLTGRIYITYVTSNISFWRYNK